MKKILIILAGLAVIIGVVLSIVSVINKNKQVKEDLLVPGFVEKSNIKKTASELILGQWRSIEDPKFVRSFSREQVVDMYEDKITGSAGKWTIFSYDNLPADFTGIVEKGASYISLDFRDSKLFFKITDISKSNLELVYIDRGNVLSFVRVPELE